MSSTTRSAAARPAKKRYVPEDKTLCCVLQCLAGMKLKVELQNESEVRGTLEYIDRHMNMKLVQCTVKAVQKRVHAVEHIFLPGTKIRFIHVPDDVDIGTALEDFVRMFGVCVSTEVPVRTVNE
jgi:small nuclear ribonucleoprotein (snRNP)-like protein